MTAILLALGSSVGFGVSDFLASRVTKRVAPVLLVLYSQTLQGIVLLVVVLAVSQPFSGAGLAWGTAAGAVGAAGLVAYYQALAVGQTAIVAPLASSGAVLPLVVDLAGGERPGPLALAGLVMVLTGIAVTSLASVERDEEAPAPTWHGPPATRRRVAMPRPRPCRSCSPGGRADRAQPVRRRLPGLRGDPGRPGHGRRAGLAGPGGHGAAGPRPDRRAPQRPQNAGAALAVLGTLVVSAAQAVT